MRSRNDAERIVAVAVNGTGATTMTSQNDRPPRHDRRHPTIGDDDTDDVIRPIRITVNRLRSMTYCDDVVSRTGDLLTYTATLTRSEQ